MPSKPEFDRIKTLLLKRALSSAVGAVDQNTSLEEVDSTLSSFGLDSHNLLDMFASTAGSQDLDKEVLEAYVLNRCTDEQRRMVEAMIEIDPRTREWIEIVRLEILVAITWSPPAGNTTSRAPTPKNRVDIVHFSVTSPQCVVPGSVFVLDLWAHLESQREEMIERARQAHSQTPIMVQTKGPNRLTRGVVLSVTMVLEGLIVDPCEDALPWEGEIGNATFPVRVPRNASDGPRQGSATVFADGMRIVRIDFVLHIAATQGEVSPLKAQETRYRTAFASYSSKDREEVAGRIHGIQKGIPGIKIFWDRHSLRSGDHWDEVIQREIPIRDIFYLFWSYSASQSPHVEKEWRLALATRGIDVIDPVPLVSPDVVPPPPELAALHFNDWVLAYTRRPIRSPRHS